MSHFRGLFALLPLAGQLLLPPSHVLAAPTLGDDGILSISARDIANNDLATHEGHPMMDKYARWLQSSTPHTLMIRSNASSVVERFPTFSGVECHPDHDGCLIVSKASIPDGITPEALVDEEEDDETSIAARGAIISPRFGWEVKNLVAELHYKTYHWLTNDDGEDEYAGFEHYITFNWVCRAVTFKSNGGELMASHDFKEWGGGAIPVGVVSTTVMHNGPLHNELLTVRFGCGFKNNRCCDDGGSETLSIAGKPAKWAAKPERTCNWGKQSNKKKEKCE